MLQIWRRTADGAIVQYGNGLAPAPDASITLETIVDPAIEQAVVNAFSAPNGGVAISADGRTVTLLAPKPDPPMPPALVERLAAGSDLKAQYQAGMDRLTQIETAVSPTNAQVVQAVRDMATIQKRLLRLVADALT